MASELNPEFYRSVFEHSDDGVLFTDTDGHILAANPAACRMLGHTEEELRRIGRAGVLDPDDPRVAPALAARAHTGRLRAEFNFVRADGSRFVGETTAATFTDADGNARLAVAIRDISERKRLELEREQYLRFFMLSTDPMCIADPFGCFTRVNPAFAQLTGYSEAELLSRPFLEFVVPEDRQRTLDEMQLQVSTRPSLRFENRYRSKDGRVLLLSWTAYFDKRDGVTFATARDTTDLTAARQQLEDVTRQQAAMLDNDLVSMMRVRNREIVWANAAAHRLFQYAPGELIGRSMRVLYPDQDAFEAAGAASYPELLAGRPYRTQTELVCKDGTPVYIDGYGAALHTDTRDSLWVMSDLTPIRQAQAQLLEAQKMEAVGRLAGGVAHDFNNMLQAILGAAELALAEAPAGSALARDLHEIETAARRSAALTRQLLAFARKQVVDPIVLDLNQAVTSTLTLLRRLVPERVALVWMPRDALWPVRIDPVQCDQIVSNLILNARDAIAEKGTVTVEAQNVTVERTSVETRRGVPRGEYVRLTVRDTGCGMDGAALAHVFEPFYTTKPFGTNAGLGLASVYGVVKQNGGWIVLDSAVGAGTKVAVYLPRVAAAVEAEPPRPLLAPALSRATILLVEDQPALLANASTMLKSLGYTLLTATSGEQALARVNGYDGPLDLLVTDVMLPGLNGRQLAETLRATHPHLPVLFLSGYPAEVLVARGSLGEGSALLQKPFTLAELSDQIRSALAAAAVADR